MGGGLSTFLQSRNSRIAGAALAALVIAGGGFWAGRATAPVPVPARTQTVTLAGDPDADADDVTVPDSATQAPATAAEAAPAPRTHSHRGEAEGAAVIKAATKASGLMYVHRNNSDLRKEPSYASETLKKEPKGAQVQMVALSDKWAEVKDGGVEGWMRSSVLKDTPPDAPGARHPRKKTAGDSSD